AELALAAYRDRSSGERDACGRGGGQRSAADRSRGVRHRETRGQRVSEGHARERIDVAYGVVDGERQRRGGTLGNRCGIKALGDRGWSFDLEVGRRRCACASLG